jgi:HKD family nuclease
MLPSGIYEQVINKLINSQLNTEENIVKTEHIDSEEASKILSRYFSEILEKGLDNLKDSGGDISKQIELFNKLVSMIANETDESFINDLTVDKRAEQLMAYLEKMNSIHAVDSNAEIIRPVTSIAQSSLFTGAVKEPSMFSELKKEILSCDRMDMLVSFIKWSGLRLIIDELKTFTQKGELRVITTSYMGATDSKAIQALSELPNTEIKISYDTKRTRLHAKTYVFYRNSGFTTAYIGSSNLSNVAISSGLEWNVRATQKDLPETIKKVEATFESYWNSSEFVDYNPSELPRLEAAIKAEKGSYQDSYNFNFNIQPYPYQSEILDKLKAERNVKNHWRNLIVAATGTGKTVISAIDYRNYHNKNKTKPCRLLFVAHREEILKQSLACFKTVLKDANFGELYNGNNTPQNLDHLFMSIQTFNSKEFEKITTPDYYDYIVVDEFHHAAAPS